MGIILLNAKHSIEIPEPVVTWEDRPEFALSSEDFRVNVNRVIDQTVIHTTTGEGPQTFGEIGPSGQGAENNARYWRRNKNSASAQLLVDSDGSIVQTHFLIPIIAWHAKGASPRSIGIECVQTNTEKKVFRVQARTCASIIRGLVLCGHSQIKLANPDGSINVRTEYDSHTAHVRKVFPGTPGVYGHRDVCPEDRGRNDPGDFLMIEIATSLEALGIQVNRGA